VTEAEGALAQLRRWEASGAHWRVLRGPTPPGGELEIALLSCDAGEEMGRLRSADPDLLGHVGDRASDLD
jgi:hypothetical protein